jgi:inosine/xanthosine triphosphatase
MRLVIGSTNPAKTSAARAICERAFPGCEVLEREVPSGVRAQPIGEEETERGARTRALGALREVEGAALGMGLEGGVDAQGHLINCVVVVDREGRENSAWGVRFALPPAVAQRVLAGEELGPVMDALTGLQQSKRTLGAVGILSNGLFTRAEMWQGPLACALIPFLHPELYR